MEQPGSFGDPYADHYDALYADKDYAAECDLIERAFGRFADERAVRSVMALGCGTGSHALLLARRGYRVTGVDRSAAMLRVAARKSADAGVTVRWVEGDLQSASLGGPFDAVICMFAVLGYLGENGQLLAALANIRRHLRAGGLLLFDVWYGPAVLAAGTSERVKVIRTPRGQVIRATTPLLDTRHHRCEVRFRLWQIDGDRVTRDVEEVHHVRFFFPLELDLLLSTSGFEPLSLTAFPTLERPVGDGTWNVFVVARAGAARRTSA